MSLFLENVDDIISAAKQEWIERGGITQYSPGSKAQALLDIVNKQLAKSFAILDFGLLSSLIRNATGLNLEFLGEIVGVIKNKATFATVDKLAGVIKFYTNAATFGEINSGSPISLRKGDKVYSAIDANGDVIVFTLIEDTVLIPTVNSQYVSAIASKTGTDYNVGTNTLVNHTVINYTDHANSSLLVTNVAPISNALAIENDEEYRYRIMNSRLSAVRGNETAVRIAGLSVAGVADIVMNEFSTGIGTGELVVVSTTTPTSDQVLADVEAAIFNYTSYGIEAFITKPNEIGLKLVITYKYKFDLSDNRKNQIEQEARRRLISYILKQPLGASVALNNIADLLMFTDDVASMGTPNRPLDEVRLFYEVEGVRRPATLMKDISLESDERLIPEYTTNFLIINRK